ncbi:MAG: hypothetical protein NXI04_06170 [Planctomycetaceae bacterium]|nr:hypothetical protein [Planctomycetaceae bacterium]
MPDQTHRFLSPVSACLQAIRQWRSKPSRRRCRLWSSGDRLEDRQLLTPLLISLAAENASGEDDSMNPQLSGNGRFVAFQSDADNLVTSNGTDDNGGRDVFVRDLETDTTVLISATASGAAGNGGSFQPSISDDGRFVAFASFATDLVSDATFAGGPQVFLRDRDADGNGIFDEPDGSRTILITRDATAPEFSANNNSGGSALGDQWATRPVISGDGSSIVFGSASTRLLDPEGGVTDLFVDVDLYRADAPYGGGVQLVSVNDSGTAAAVAPGAGVAWAPSVDRRGEVIAFDSNNVDLVAGDDEGFSDVFVSTGGSAVRISESDSGKGGNGDSREPIVSRNGRHVVFRSEADNLVPGDNNGVSDLFVVDLDLDEVKLVSRSRDPDSESATANAMSPGATGYVKNGYAISSNGRFIVFSSTATDLLDASLGITDTNGTSDVFVLDRDADQDFVFDETQPGSTRTIPVSVNASGLAMSNSSAFTGGSNAVSISDDGRYVVFTSPGTDLVDGGSTGTAVYIRDLEAGVTQLVGETGTVEALMAFTASAFDTEPLRTIFASGNDLDAAVSDTNIALDLFEYTAAIDIDMRSVVGDGYDLLEIQYTIENEAASQSFEIGIYRSRDGLFDPETDTLLDTILITGTDLDQGGHSLIREIGSGPDQVMLPGAGIAETDDDYQLLFVADHEDILVEFDADAFNDDNVARFQNLYHLPGGPVFAHGRTGIRVQNDQLTVTEIDLATTEVRLGLDTYTYDPADVTGVRFRGHEGHDQAQGGGTPDAFFGGSGNDSLAGGPGDDLLYGGIDEDKLIGEAGFDTIADGMGDDFVDVGPDGGDVISTPGSDDIFIGAGDDSHLDFSLANHSIDLELDLDNDLNLDGLLDAIQTVDLDGNTIQLLGGFRNFTGSLFDDRLSIPNSVIFDTDDLLIVLDGFDGDDIINIDVGGRKADWTGRDLVIDSGATIRLNSFEDFSIVNFAPVTIDNSDLGYADTGFFDSNPQFAQGVNGGVRFSAAGSGNAATWTFTDLPPGPLQVASTWTHAPDRASNAPLTIRSGSDALAVVTRNLEQPPDDFTADGFHWETLTLLPNFSGGNLTVELTDSTADEFVVADAIRIEPAGEKRLLDDDSPHTTTTGGQRVDGPGLLGGQRVFPAGPATTVATWDLSHLLADPRFVAGRHELFADWAGLSGAATNAQFRIVNAGAAPIVTHMDQSLDAGDGVTSGTSLGVFDLDARETLSVTLDSNPTGPVIADAIFLRPAAEIVTLLFDDDIDSAPIVFAAEDPVFLGSLPHVADGDYPVRTVHIRNDGPKLLTLGQATVSGPYTISQPAATVPPNSSTAVRISLNPNQIGAQSGWLTIPTDAPGGPLVINLTSEVVADSTPPEGQVTADIHRATDQQVSVEVRFISLTDSFFERIGMDLDLQLHLETDAGLQPLDFSPSPLIVSGEQSLVTLDELSVLEPGAGGILQLEATPVDAAGNRGETSRHRLHVMPHPDLTVQIPPFEESIELFGDDIFSISVEPTEDVPLRSTELLVNGQVVDTSSSAPFISQLTPFPADRQSTLQGRATDVFGNVAFTELITITPDHFGHISGQKWHDQNGNGRRDAGEPGLDGWTLEILDEDGLLLKNVVTQSIDLNEDGLIDPVTERGLYTTAIAAGRYTVQEAGRAGWRQTSPHPSAVATRARELDVEFDFSATRSDFLNWGGRQEKWFFGRRDRQWFFVVPDGTVLAWDGSGPDNLTGREVGQLNTAYYDDIRLIHAAPPAGSLPVQVLAGQTTADVSFGNSETAAIAGQSWHDANRNGVRDAGESGVSGRTIRLFDADGQLVQTTVTANRDLNGDDVIDPETEAGHFLFAQLATGQFTLSEDLPDGWTPTSPDPLLWQRARELDQSRSLRQTRSDFRNWGSLDERWVLGDDGWYFITPDGRFYQWDGSPRTALTGTLIAILNRSFWQNITRLTAPPVDLRHSVSVPDVSRRTIDFGSVAD